jgi:hypothetical protein
LIKNPRHQQWHDLVMGGGISGTKAYMQVYPNAGKLTAEAEASSLKRKYRDETFDYVKDAIKFGSPIAVNALIDMIKAKTTSEGVRFKAAKEILDYAGHRAATEVTISIEDKTEEELDARILQLTKDMAIDAEVIK